MSIHPSLRSVSKGRQHRSVLKRFERVAVLEKQERWQEGDSVFGLPKVRSIKVRVKKEKAQAEAATAAGVAPGEGVPQAAAKEETKPKKGSAVVKEESKPKKQ
ncbi:MAG: small basic protein [Candidatus Omnitrophica bacterium]|nr:small basic protein [Candidatus Omnitrophota bacterium]